MFNLSEDRYLSNSSARDPLRLCLQLDLFDSDDFLGGSVYTLVDNTVCSLAQSGYLLDLVYLPKTEWLLHRLIHLSK